jgi:hypothetical protein
MVQPPPVTLDLFETLGVQPCRLAYRFRWVGDILQTTMSPTDPRTAFGLMVRQRLYDELGLTISDYAETLGRKLGRPPAIYRNFIDRVVSGSKAVPTKDAKPWAEGLGWYPGSEEFISFMEMHAAARAWGKKDGHGHLARLEAENARLLGERNRLAAALERSEARCGQLEARHRAMEDRLAFLEASELKRP